MWDLPKSGDIVWGFFPEFGDDRSGPKPRPCLVLAVDSVNKAVQVVPGTSKKLEKLYSGEVTITKTRNTVAFKKAGLFLDTKFQFGAKKVVPWDDDYFQVRHDKRYGDHPKIGTLDESMNKNFATAYNAVKK